MAFRDTSSEYPRCKITTHRFRRDIWWRTGRTCGPWSSFINRWKECINRRPRVKAWRSQVFFDIVLRMCWGWRWFCSEPQWEGFTCCFTRFVRQVRFWSLYVIIKSGWTVHDLFGGSTKYRLTVPRRLRSKIGVFIYRWAYGPSDAGLPQGCCVSGDCWPWHQKSNSSTNQGCTTLWNLPNLTWVWNEAATTSYSSGVISTFDRHLKPRDKIHASATCWCSQEAQIRRDGAEQSFLWRCVQYTACGNLPRMEFYILWGFRTKS